ncbi:MAG: T9SS type A sorting domain-containing protein [Saprospiraceae bacterium]
MSKGLLYTATLLIFIGGVQSIFAQGNTLSNPSNCNLGLEIVDNNCPEGQVFYNPNQFRINVNNVFGTRLGTDIYLKEVRLVIRHEWAGDLDISLISPGGKTVKLSFDNGGGNENYGNPDAPGCAQPVVFSMAACKSIKNGLAPFVDGPYQPEESFFLLNDGVTNPNGQWILQICDDVAEDVGTLEYVELKFESITCLPITNVSVVEVDTTTVKLAWQPDDCTPVIIEYGAPGFTPGTGAQAGQGMVVTTNSCSPYALQGLQPFTEYDVYIRRVCNFGANFSDNSCVLRVRTGCLPPPATIIENFDNYDECSTTCGAVCDFPGIWRNGSGDDFDWLVYRGKTPTVNTGPGGDVNGGLGKYVYLESSGTACTNGRQTHLISNCIRINKQGTDTCHMSFNYHMWGVNIGTLRLQYSTDGGATWATMWERSGNQGNTWHKVYLSLNQFADGSIVRFRFVGIGGNGSRGDIALDHIVLFGSEDLGAPDMPFYVDADGDGYGNPNQFIFSCLEDIPDGFTLTGGDCNDNNPAINPGAPEVACNNIDNNCNGNADETILPAPLVQSDTICSGDLAVVLATPLSGKPIFWYGSPDGDDVIGTGNGFFPNLPENNSPAPIIYKFYAEESDFVCRSGTRAEALVVINPRPDLSHIGTPSVCPGESFDLSSLTIQDANFTGAAITFHSGTPASVANQLPNSLVKPSVTATYYYRAISSEGCADESNVSVFVKPTPTVRFSPAKTFGLCLDGDGFVTVNASGGAGSYNYLWNTGDTDATIAVKSDSVVGNINRYTVTVTDAAGCNVTDTVAITTTNSIDSVRVSTRSATSCTGSNGGFTITPLGGQAPFSYAWSSNNGANNNIFNVTGPVTIDNLRQGAYRVTITDSSPQGCEIELRQVIINGPSTVVERTQVRNVSCPGASDGGIFLSVIGGNPTYRWSNGATTASLQNITGGTYAVTITDGACETVLSDLVVNEPEPLKILQNLVEPSCAETANGAINLTIFGGTKDYTFLWNTGARREDLNNIAAGNYQVTVSDARGCTLVESIALTAPTTLSIETDSLKNVSCPGLSDGFLKIQANGGTAPYQYEWNTGSIAPVLPNLPAGNYTVTITDFKGCQRVGAIPISQPNSLTINLLRQNNPRCVGETNGLLVLSAQGGTQPYTFNWNTGEQGSSLVNLGVGDYTVTLTDANGCAGGSDTFQLTASSPISVALNVTQPECFGRQDGNINIQPTGSAPFKYNWNRGDITQNLTNVAAGTYAVTIEDAQGCLFDTTVTVSAPKAIDVRFGISQPSCAQSADGIIQVNFIQAGSPPLNYNWNNGSTSKDLVNLSQGNYVLNLTDSRGCRFVSDTIVIQNPPPLQLITETLGQIACKDDSTGFIEIDVKGGTQPYRYQWVGLDEEEADIFNLPAGDYRLVVRDKNDCPIDTTFRLTEPTELLAEVDVRISGECDAQYSNELRATVSGGRAPYRYLWSNGDTNAILTNVLPGDYELTVQDANGCAKQISSIKVRGAGTALTVDTFFVKNISCFGANDGKMTVRVAGGSPPFQFHFSNGRIEQTNLRELTVENLPLNNNYSVTVTDLSSGCITVSPRRSISGPLPLSFIFDNLNEPNCFASADGEIYASTYGGTAPFTYRWFNTNNVQVGSTEDLTRVPNGTYVGIVIDANGCQDTINQQVVVQNNRELIRMSDFKVTNAKCKGDRTGGIDVTIAGGKAPYTFRWSNNRTTEDLINVPANAYGLTVTDADTCRVIFPSIRVGEPDAKVSIVGKVNDADCAGNPTGSIEVLVQGGTPPYELIWEYKGNIFVQNTSNLTNLAAGNYMLSVRDTNQCVETAAFEVKQPNPLSIDILRSNDGNRASAEVRGGTPEYAYLWNTGDTTQTIQFATSGEYTVTVTDARGCRSEMISMLVSDWELQMLETARLYPNPSTGAVTIELQLRKPLDFTVEIWNMLGQNIEQHNLVNTQSLQLPLNLHTQASGLYQVTISAEGRRVVLGNFILNRR